MNKKPNIVTNSYLTNTMHAYNKLGSTCSGWICCYPNLSCPTPGTKKDCHCLALQQESTMRSLTPPPPHRMGGRVGKKKAKLVGWDEEQQTKRTITTIRLIKWIYKARDMQCKFPHCPCPAYSQAAIPLPQPAFPVIYWAWHHVTRYLIWLFWVRCPGCVPSQLLVKVNSILAKNRTVCMYVLIRDYIVCFLVYHWKTLGQQDAPSKFNHTDIITHRK